MLVSIISDPAIGGTFLSWTLHYLSGHSEYLHCKTKTYNKLPTNPLISINAHGFKGNHPWTILEFEDSINLLINQPTEKFHTLYIHTLIDTESPGYINQAVAKLQTISNKTILLYTTQNLYHVKNQSRTESDTVRSNIVESLSEYFLESKKHWSKGINNSWDLREFLALNIRPYQLLNIVPSFNCSKNHYALECNELFTCFDQTVKHLFDFLDLTIDQTRWNSWLEVYRTWQRFHTSRLLFATYFDKIIESIVHGYYLDLTRFDLDIYQEAVIQHELIYKHGLNIKGWGLEKFLNNTQDLHKLLEPNTQHQVEDIYNCLKRK
jgi:hypothetical protein